MVRCLVVLVAVVGLVGCQTPRQVAAPSLSPPVVVGPAAQNAQVTVRQPEGRTPVVTPPPERSAAVRGRVIIDPGHGGKDPGTKAASGMVEKHLVLSVGMAAAERLRARGVDVRMTRTDDRFIELDDRAYSATQYRADLFVSIHADWNPGAGKRGHTILLPQSHTPGSSALAQAISRSLVSVGWPAYNIRTDTRGLVVLKKTSCPAVLVEIGFLSNPSDASQLSSPAMQARLGQAIGDGVAEYLRGR